jgi:hypothetical protein
MANGHWNRHGRFRGQHADLIDQGREDIIGIAGDVEADAIGGNEAFVAELHLELRRLSLDNHRHDKRILDHDVRDRNFRFENGLKNDAVGVLNLNRDDGPAIGNSLAGNERLRSRSDGGDNRDGAAILRVAICGDFERVSPFADVREQHFAGAARVAFGDQIAANRVAHADGGVGDLRPFGDKERVFILHNDPQSPTASDNARNWKGTLSPD